MSSVVMQKPGWVVAHADVNGAPGVVSGMSDLLSAGTNGYDSLGRLTSKSGSGTGITAASRTVGYDLLGNLTSASAPGGTITAAYDDRNLPVSVACPQGTTTSAYDASGRLTTNTTGSGTSTYTWNSRSLLATQTDPLTGVTATNAFDNAGQKTQTTYGSAITRNFSYDERGRITNDTLLKGSVAENTLTYGYDANGNMTSRSMTLDNNAANGAQTATYDKANRLTSWRAPTLGATNYAWDDDGNLTQNGATAISYDQRDRITSQGRTAYTWNANGDPITIGTKTQTYDALDQLTKSGITTYSYDGLGRLASRNGTTFAYGGLGRNLAADNNAKYVWQPDGSLLSDIQGTSPATIMGQDSHGDVVWQTVPSNGSVRQTAIWDPFGTVARKQGTLSGVGFQGQYTDHTTNNTNMGSRWFMAGTDSFSSQDSYGGSPSNPLTQNRYAYGNDNPLTNVDPTGHSAESTNGSSAGVSGEKTATYQTTVYQAGASQVSYAVTNLTDINADVKTALQAEETQGLKVNTTEDPSHQGWHDDGSFLASVNRAWYFVKSVPGAIWDQLKTLPGRVWNGLQQLPGKLAQTWDNLTSGHACLGLSGSGTCGNQALTPKQAVEAVGTVIEVASVVLPVLGFAGKAIDAVQAVRAAQALEVVDETGGAIETGTQLKDVLLDTNAIKKLRTSRSLLAEGERPVTTLATAADSSAGLSFSDTQVQSVIDQHGGDFSFSGVNNAAGREDFISSVVDHVDDPGTVRIPGTYRGTQPAVHFYNPNSGLNAIFTPQGGFWTGWNLYPSQIRDLLSTGNVT